MAKHHIAIRLPADLIAQIDAQRLTGKTTTAIVAEALRAYFEGSTAQAAALDERLEALDEQITERLEEIEGRLLALEKAKQSAVTQTLHDSYTKRATGVTQTLHSEDEERVTDVQQRVTSAPPEPLTASQLAEGLTASQLATRLDVSLSTVWRQAKNAPEEFAAWCKSNKKHGRSNGIPDPDGLGWRIIEQIPGKPKSALYLPIRPV